MSLFSRLFGEHKRRPTKRGVEELFAEMIERTIKQTQPVGEVSRVIVKVAIAICDAVKHLAREEAQDEDTWHATEVAVFYQSIYFTRAVTFFVADNCLGHECPQLDRFARFLDPLLASIAISSYYNVCSERFPQEFKDRLIRDYYECGDNAELEFRECTKSDSGKRGEERFGKIMDALLIQTVKNISSMLSENNDDYLTVISAITPAITTFYKEIVPAVAKLKNADLPCVDSTDLLRHLMTSSKRQQ